MGMHERWTYDALASLPFWLGGGAHQQQWMVNRYGFLVEAAGTARCPARDASGPCGHARCDAEGSQEGPSGTEPSR